MSSGKCTSCGSYGYLQISTTLCYECQANEWRQKYEQKEREYIAQNPCCHEGCEREGVYEAFVDGRRVKRCLTHRNAVREHEESFRRWDRENNWKQKRGW